MKKYNLFLRVVRSSLVLAIFFNTFSFSSDALSELGDFIKKEQKFYDETRKFFEEIVNKEGEQDLLLDRLNRLENYLERIMVYLEFNFDDFKNKLPKDSFVDFTSGIKLYPTSFQKDKKARGVFHREILNLIAKEDEAIYLLLFVMRDNDFETRLLSNKDVDVRIVWDDKLFKTMNTVERYSDTKFSMNERNRKLFTNFRQNGIQTRRYLPYEKKDPPNLHSKMMIFKGQKKVVFGSANPTFTAFERNYELSAIVNIDDQKNSDVYRYFHMIYIHGALQEYIAMLGVVKKNIESVQKGGGIVIEWF